MGKREINKIKREENLKKYTKELQRERSKAYYDANKAEILAKQKAKFDNLTPKEKANILDTKKRYYQSKKEEIKNRQLEYSRRPEVKKRASIKAKERREAKKGVYVVYSHINKANEIYIGCGQKNRAYDFTNRGTNWIDVFYKNFKVNIIGEFKLKADAERFEALLIRDIGIKNLVNKNQPKLK